ncbi:MAG: hypothetical protein A2066_10830 [Bacteroidetes bacterium GWB2_41_8]|nr:MAG: hypothetical protein A2066_10830 [Bacteroidetes bacterium GWB2_41_8]
MFGLDTITWTKFITMLFLLCSIYYAAVFIRAWISRSGRTSGNLFENADETDIQPERLLPVSVYALDYPGELIPFNHIEPVDLKVDFYQENGIDEGYNLEQFYEDHLSHHPEILEKVQHQ